MSTDDAMIRCRRETSRQLVEVVPWARSADEALRALIKLWRDSSDKSRTLAMMRVVRERAPRR